MDGAWLGSAWGEKEGKEEARRCVCGEERRVMIIMERPQFALPLNSFHPL
jgi:hypothetical protein